VYGDNEQIMLKRSHQYYAQIQGQMAITERKWCHFFVYSKEGVHLEVINFDQEKWKLIEENLVWFYAKYLKPQ